MPPKNRISKEDIVKAAFMIAKEEGFVGVTARNVADRLGCSVAPIYVNFASINDVIEAVIQRIFAICEELLAEQTGPDMFENIGKASVVFAREYPVFLRELIMQPNPYMESYETVENTMLNMLDQDEAMRDWTIEERKKLLLKMRIFQTGLTVMVANGHIPSWLDDKAVEDLLAETEEDLLLIQRMKKEGKMEDERSETPGRECTG